MLLISFGKIFIALVILFFHLMLGTHIFLRYSRYLWQSCILRYSLIFFHLLSLWTDHSHSCGLVVLLFSLLIIFISNFEFDVIKAVRCILHIHDCLHCRFLLLTSSIWCAATTTISTVALLWFSPLVLIILLLSFYGERIIIIIFANVVFGALFLHLNYLLVNLHVCTAPFWSASARLTVVLLLL